MNSAQDTLAGGLPHSEIPGSPIARISPGLFAACHVLHRLSVPRHPPDALASRLIIASPSPAMPHHRRAQGQTPCLAPATAGHGGLYEDTSLGQAWRQRPRWAPARWRYADRRRSASPTGPVRLGHITTLSSPFNQPRRGRPRRCRAIFSERRARPRNAVGLSRKPVARSQPGCAAWWR